MVQKRQKIRELLGIPQEELALLLKVTRSQLSMYELGKRNLPVAATIQLAEILSHIHEDLSQSKKDLDMVTLQKKEAKKLVEELLVSNQYKQLVIEKKLALAKKKYQNNLKALNLMGILEQQTFKKATHEHQLVKNMETRALQEITHKRLPTITQLELKIEMLQEEEKFLKKKRQKLR